MSTDLPELKAAEAAVAAAQLAIEALAARLAAGGVAGLDQEQVLAYDLAHAAAAVDIAGAALRYGAKGPLEAHLAAIFAADAVYDVATRSYGREMAWGMTDGALDAARPFVAAYRAPAQLAAVADGPGRRHLDPDFELVADTFRRFAEERIAPIASQVHRTNSDIPEAVIAGLAELGAFGLSIPAVYGGYAADDDRKYLGMVVATEELSRVSLGAGGSLITRPEILARALIRGGTEDQKRRWLAPLAAGEIMAAVAVTEPDYGSDVAGIAVTATRNDDGWVINGAKTWSTFAARADVIMVLARTDPDRARAHQGLSMFVVPKGRGDGRGFTLAQPKGGRLEAHPIDTIGYRGMHSYELVFAGWQVDADSLVGGDEGIGQGFYLQMEGFDSGRLQTAARAVGVMQAAYEAAIGYAKDRRVFGRPLMDFQLTQAKLGRMTAVIQACRQYMYETSRLMANGAGSLEASMVKAYTCRAAEWITREAVQIHGGMGYAEESQVSRLFVDARVLSIFEGADETLAIKVIARRLVTGDRPAPSS